MLIPSPYRKHGYGTPQLGEVQKRVTIRLPEPLYDEAIKLAHPVGGYNRMISRVIRDALEFYIAHNQHAPHPA